MLPRVLIVLACALGSATALAACGDDGHGGAATKPTGARATLEQTFGASATSIDSAKLDAALKLVPEGLLKLGGPIALKIDGPFAAPTASTPPRFDLALLATLGGRQFKAAALSTATQTYLRLDDRTYALARRGRARDDGGGRHPGLQALGIDPLRWVTNVRDEGSERVAGAETEHLSGDVDAKLMLADIGRLLDKAGGKQGAILSPALLDQIAAAVTSAKVDIWTGADDHILRRLAVDARFAFKRAQSPIVGLDGGRLTFRVRLDDVNRTPVKVTAPSGARPLSEVTGAGGLNAFLGGLGAGITGGIGGGAIELVGCVTHAQGSAAQLVRCVSKLAP